MRMPCTLIGALLALCSSSACLAMGKPLVICLEQESPPYSTRAGGIDNDVALAVADALGLPLTIHWYETDAGDEGNPALMINALLSAGRCELAGGFAMTQNNFADPAGQKFSLETQEGERQQVALQPLAPSLAYHAQTFALIWSVSAGTVPTSLDDFSGHAILVEESSVADLILMAHRGGSLRKSLRHTKTGAESLFSTLATGEADGAWATQHQFEYWQRHHPESSLKDSGLTHDFAINLGFAALKSNYQLLERVDETIEQLIEDGELELLFLAQQLTYQAPQPPRLMPPLSTRLLNSQ